MHSASVATQLSMLLLSNPIATVVMPRAGEDRHFMTSAPAAMRMWVPDRYETMRIAGDVMAFDIPQPTAAGGWKRQGQQ
nr:hypothetical protein [Desulfofustis glycolicus]